MPLSDEQRAYLERRLEEERARVLGALNRGVAEHSRAEERERAGDLSAVPLHLADIGTDAIQEEIDAANETRESNELAEIDAALERLRQDPERFGICEDSGAEIPFERLSLIPWARTCARAGA